MILGMEIELIRRAGRRRLQVELCNERRRSSWAASNRQKY